jgi:hypothetical protein
MDYLSIVRARGQELRSRAWCADACVRAPRSQQALLFKRAGLSMYQQTRIFLRYTKRLS